MNINALVNRLSHDMKHNRLSQAKNHLSLIWPHFSELAPGEMDFVMSVRDTIYPRKDSGLDTEAAAYWEGKILAEQEME